MQPPTLAGAVLPADVVEASTPAGQPAFYTLADAKNTIGMRQEQTDLDGYITTLISTAAAVLAQATGLEFKAAPGAEARYCIQYTDCRSLCIPESDVATITSITLYPATGASSALDAANYEVKRSFGRTYILRSDDKYFPASRDGVSVVVVYARGVAEDSNQADMIRGGMAYLVKGLFDGDGTATDKMRSSPDFLRIVRLLKSQRSYI